MSAEAEAWAWRQQGITPAQKFVLIGLANRSDEEGVCWRGQKGLAERCRIGQRALQYHFRALIKAGLLNSESRHRKDGSRTSNLYTLNMQISSPPSEDGFVGVAKVAALGSEGGFVGILEETSNKQLKEEKIHTEDSNFTQAEPPKWLKLLRELEEWPSKGRPHEESLELWVVGQDYSPGLLEGSAIGLGAAQAKTLKGYKNLAKAFQDRLMKGFDDPAKRALRNNGARPVNPSLTANTTDAVRLAQEQNERG